MTDKEEQQLQFELNYTYRHKLEWGSTYTASITKETPDHISILTIKGEVMVIAKKAILSAIMVV